jgi:hypothetical protein
MPTLADVTTPLDLRPALLAAAEEETNTAALVVSFAIAGAFVVLVFVVATRVQRSREAKAIGPLAFALERRRRPTPPHLQGTMEKATWVGVHAGRAVEVSTLQVQWLKTFHRVSVATTTVAGLVDPPAAVLPGYYPDDPRTTRIGWHGHDDGRELHEFGAPDDVRPLHELDVRGVLRRPGGRRAAVIRDGDELHVAIAADLHQAVELLVVVADALGVAPAPRAVPPVEPVR